MKKIIVVLLSALTLLFSACNSQNAQKSSAPAGQAQTTAPTPKPNEKAPDLSDYFPFKENIHMKYRGEGNEYAEYETYVDYIGNGAIQIRTINPGTAAVSVYVIEDGALKKVYFEGEIYYRLDYTRSRETEEILIKEPIKAGNSWKLEDGSTRSVTAVNTKVKVPYGTYEALEVTTAGAFSTTKNYYVSGIGLVKSEFKNNEDASSKITSELETVEQESRLKQNVRFYYPDFNNDRLVYIEKTIELYTGEDVLKLFEEQVRQVPENSGLQPLMSENTSILGIDYDRKTAVVTVDFSSEFISDMNAGSLLESMLIISVADTFGSYFQTNKVAITIEGGPYESGHFYFKNGEYLTADLEGVLEYRNQ